MAKPGDIREYQGSQYKVISVKDDGTVDKWERMENATDYSKETEAHTNPQGLEFRNPPKEPGRVAELRSGPPAWMREAPSIALSTIGAMAVPELGVIKAAKYAPKLMQYGAKVIGSGIGGMAGEAGSQYAADRELDPKEIALKGGEYAAGEAVLPPLVQGASKLWHSAKSLFHPSGSPVIQMAEKEAKNANINLTPGQRGSRFAASVEGYQLRDPLTGAEKADELATQQAAIRGHIEKKFPAIEPSKIGKQARDVIDKKSLEVEQQINDAYTAASVYPSRNIGERNQARRAILNEIDAVLSKNGMLADSQGLKATVRTAGNGVPGTVIAEIDPRVANEIAALRQSEELTSKVVDPAAIERVRRSMYKAGKRFSVDRIDKESLAAWDRIYKSLKEAQKLMYAPEGRPILDAADTLFKGDLETKRKLAFLDSIDNEDIAKIFKTRDVEELQELAKQAPEVFEKLQMSVTRNIVDSSPTVAVFERKVKDLGDETASMLPYLEEARQAVALKQVAKIPENASFSPEQGFMRPAPTLKEWPGLIIANRFLKPVYESKAVQEALQQPATPFVAGYATKAGERVSTPIGVQTFEALRQREAPDLVRVR
jgi:hypothetical protein